MIKNFHPITLFVLFLYIIFASAFTFNPIFLLSGLSGGICFLLIIDSAKAYKSLAAYLFIFMIIAISNPLFSHNGATILFFINDSRITLESLIYGITASMMIIGVLVWFNCFNKVFDSEKVMYLIGRFFPKTVLVFSMTLNYIPRLIKEFKSINNAQKSIKQNRLKRYVSSFSAVITRGMEGAIVTSDSMNARGYSLKGRTFFYKFRFTFYDLVWLLLFTVLFVLSIVWQCDVKYYPYFEIKFSALSAVSAVTFVILSFLPFIIEVKEALKWKFSLSRI